MFLEINGNKSVKNGFVLDKIELLIGVILDFKSSVLKMGITLLWR